MDSNMQSAWYKNKVVLGVVVVILVILGITLFGGDKGANTTDTAGNNSGEPKKEVSMDLKSGEISLAGKFACTPLKSGKTPTQAECVLGLAGSDGKFYALDTSKVESIGKGVDGAPSIKVIGVLTPVNANSEEAGIFKYDGVVAVRIMSAN